MLNQESLKDTTSDVDRIVEPAFASRTQALSFLFLIVFALALPLLIDATGAVSRQQSYDLMPEHHGAYSYMKNEIFETEGDIDVLFLGSSVLWNAVDASKVESSLSQSLGRKATVVTFGFNFNGVDIPYTLLHDLLERRRIRLVIFSIPRLGFTTGPSDSSYKFLRYSDSPEVVADLSAGSRASLYACNILRSPDDLLGMLRTDRSIPSPFEADLGANKELLGLYRDPAKFERFTPSAPVVPASDLIYSKESQDKFSFTGDALTPHQEHYLRHLDELLRERRIPFAMLNVPQYSERASDKVIERLDWSKKFGHDVPLVGIAPRTLFAGLDDHQTELLHCDDAHFNKNGNEYFTQAILPALLMVYKEHASKDF